MGKCKGYYMKVTMTHDGEELLGWVLQISK